MNRKILNIFKFLLFQPNKPATFNAKKFNLVRLSKYVYYNHSLQPKLITSFKVKNKSFCTTNIFWHKFQENISHKEW